ncbi:hypothetical protein [Orenia marismortui]|nr:hypothetical protein [Orenia marismortui]
MFAKIIFVLTSLNMILILLRKVIESATKLIIAFKEFLNQFKK